ncbi:MAG: BlaI/MecI/CopY family transcriptional regulator [Oscillospiraceae bacterium]|nr:BlaI/MecI/CopY family transcriptional regulator [Oscillospiraceae bacterium]
MDYAINRIPDTELEIMQVIWDCKPPVSRADIEEGLKGRHSLAPTTILTLLSRLVERGALVTEKQGRSNVYTPVFPREEYLAAQSRRFLQKLCGGDLHVFASALCGSGLSRDEVAELRRLLDEEKL